MKNINSFVIGIALFATGIAVGGAWVAEESKAVNQEGIVYTDIKQICEEQGGIYPAVKGPTYGNFIGENFHYGDGYCEKGGESYRWMPLLKGFYKTSQEQLK